MASSELGEKLIGKGSFGKVYRVYYREGQQVVAVKKIELDYEKSIRKAMKEVEAMEKLDKHERIVQYIRHDVISDHQQEKVLHIFMEYIPGGTISSRLGSTGAFSEEETKRCMHQILEGLLFLHNQNIIHRDIKGSNILFDRNDNIKLSDFGVSKRLSELSTYDSTKAGTSTGLVGTVHWMAPEIVTSEKYGRKADVWSAGATMVEMLTKKPLWPNLEDIPTIFQISQKNKPQYNLNPSVSKGAKQFLDDVLVYNQYQRPSVKELFSHAWFGPTASVDGSSQSGNLAADAIPSDNLSDLSDDDENLIPYDKRLPFQLVQPIMKQTTKPKIKQLFSNTDKVFHMTPKRGRALIINNMNFDKRPDLCRKGSDVDVENMSAMLESLNFDVVTHKDLNAEGIMYAVKSEVKNEEHNDLGCHVLVIMTHGGLNNNIYGTDLKSVKVADVYDALTSSKFPGMAGKPKIVILEACSRDITEADEVRGTYSSDVIGLRVQQTLSYDDDACELPETPIVIHPTPPILPRPPKFPGAAEAETRPQAAPRAPGVQTKLSRMCDDFLLLESNVHSSKRILEYGSITIRALVSSMYKHACHHDLYTIFKQVHTKVRKLCDDGDLGSGGPPIKIWDTLTKTRKIYLFPGFNG